MFQLFENVGFINTKTHKKHHAHRISNQQDAKQWSDMKTHFVVEYIADFLYHKDKNGLLGNLISIVCVISYWLIT